MKSEFPFLFSECLIKDIGNILFQYKSTTAVAF